MIYATVNTSVGRVVLQRWGRTFLEAHAADLIEFYEDFGALAMSENAAERAGLATQGLYTRLENLVHASAASRVPDGLACGDLHELADAMWTLNGMDSLGKTLRRVQELHTMHLRMAARPN